jgi:hypothetical protein
MLLERTMATTRLQLVIGVLLSSVAQAQVIFAEDFEAPATGAALTPSFVFHSQPQGSGTLTGAAARRGGQGYRIVDRGTQVGQQVQLYARGSSRADLFLRFFLRIDGLENGQDHMLAIFEGQPSGVTQAFLKLDRELRLGADVKRPGSFSLAPIEGATLTRQRWSLVEFFVVGAGTANLCVRIALDGTVGGERCGVDYSAFPLGDLSLGLTYQSGAAPTGVADFDDVVFSSSPVASRLFVSSDAAALRSGECAPLRAELRGSFSNAPLEAPFDESVPVDPAFALFEDAACTRPISGVPLRAGAPRATAWVMPRANGTRPLGARPLSVLLAGEPTLTASGVPDVVAPEEPEPARSCGCSATEGPWLILLLGLGWGRRRWRWAGASARSRVLGRGGRRAPGAARSH